MKTITLNQNTILTFVETHRGVDIWHGTNSWQQTGYWYCPLRRGPRGAYEMCTNVDGVRAMIEHDAIVDTIPCGVPEKPVVGAKFVISGHYAAAIMTIELVRDAVVVARAEDGGQRIYIAGEDFGAVGGRDVSAEVFLQGFVDQERAWHVCNISSVRDSRVAGVAPLVL